MQQPQELTTRAPDWPAAAVAGLGAGAVLMVLDIVWSLALTGAGPWTSSRMIAALVLGPEMLQSTGFDLTAVTVALLAHYAFGIAGGLVFAAVSAPLRLDSTLALAVVTGAGFGLVLYVVNFYGMVNFFPWFGEVRGWTTLVINLIFGMSTAALYWNLARRGDARRELQEAT